MAASFLAAMEDFQNQVGQFQRSREGFFSAGFDNRAGNDAGFFFFAVGVDDVGDKLFFRRVDKEK